MSKVSVQLGPGERFQANLLLPAAPGATPAVADGTSNTLQFGDESAQKLRSGFGLLLPASAKSRFQAGQTLSSALLLPYSEQNNGRASGQKTNALKIQSGKVSRVTPLPGGQFTVWIEPQGIIAILIGL